MDAAHHLVLLAGALGLLSIFAGLFSARFGTPLLLVFLAIGMLFGKEGPVGLVFNDFQTAYLIGSVALAVILFEGGLKTKRSMLKIALGPALALATAGVAITAGVVCAVFALLPPPPSPYSLWLVALLIGAILAPTDAAAVAVLLRRARLALPKRVTAALEEESGLNDPMSVFLTVLLTQQVLAPRQHHAGARRHSLRRRDGRRRTAAAVVAFCCPQRFRGSMARLYAPLPTLRRRPRGRLRKARGRCRSLLLHLRGVSPHTHCGLPAQSLALRPARLLDRPRPPLSRRFDPASHPAKSLVSYQGYRQFPAWNLPPLVMQALGAHGLL